MKLEAGSHKLAFAHSHIAELLEAHLPSSSSSSSNPFSISAGVALEKQAIARSKFWLRML
ncbi:MAG: hypothetical protein D6742_08630 [Cyanobacteria bacterium J069]|nr:MAG: hypothetical protein D6742_08630 [Cyanobacteria bacterium J069]